MNDTITAPAPRPPQVQLSATPPVSGAVILVRQTPGGTFAWAASSDAVADAATGTAPNETAAHLSALEAILTHPSHTRRRLTLDVQDTPAGHELADFVTEHLLLMPVTLHSIITPGHRPRFYRAHIALEGVIAPSSPPAEHTPAAPARKQTRVVAATDGSLGLGRADGGWAWVTSNGRWDSGTIKAARILPVEVFAILRLVAAHPTVDSLSIWSDSRSAIALIDAVRSGRTTPTQAIDHLEEDRGFAFALFRILLEHPGDINLQWVAAHRGHLLNETADRLAVQARRAKQLGASREVHTSVQHNIITDLRSGMATGKAARKVSRKEARAKNGCFGPGWATAPS